MNPIERIPMIIAFTMTASWGRLFTSFSTRSSRSSRSSTSMPEAPPTGMYDPSTITKSKLFQPPRKYRHGR